MDGMTLRVRDLLVLDGGLVLASDSVGGIGPKPSDTVAADPATVAHFAVRVPLLEVLCAGAVPIAIVDALCVEFEPTGRLMIEEVHRLAREAGIPADAVTGSTEENVMTRATGVGVTVLGRLPAGAEVGTGSRAGDAVVCAGLPISAPQHDVRIGHPQQVPIPAVVAALASGVVHDALPVGSKGLAWEVPQLAASSGLEVVWEAGSTVAVTASGGPASCVLFSCDPTDLPRLRATLGQSVPVEVVARLRRLT